MSSTAQSHKISVEDYLAGEDGAEVKHEYLAGEVFAMDGAGEAHVTIAGNLFALLRNHLRGGPCRVYISDMRVRVEAADAFYYPDVLVTCAASDRAESLAKRHPSLIVEVLSDSTAAFDRGAKFAHYRQLDSLAEYLLIEPARRSADLFRRNQDGDWVLHAFIDHDQLELASLGFACPLDALYEDVEIP
jgi:Uma2 family endonuclease